MSTSRLSGGRCMLRLLPVAALALLTCLKGTGQDADSRPGLAAHYYQDPVFWEGNWPDSEPVPGASPLEWTFSTYAFTRPEPLVNHLFVHDGWFTVRWQGWLHTHPGQTVDDDEDGEAHYEFTVWADDGCRLMIDGKVLIDSWIACSEGTPAARRHAAVRLGKGRHRIVLEYFQGQSLKAHDADPMRLYWSCASRGIATKIIPATHFSHGFSDLVPLPGRRD